MSIWTTSEKMGNYVDNDRTWQRQTNKQMKDELTDLSGFQASK